MRASREPLSIMDWTAYVIPDIKFSHNGEHFGLRHHHNRLTGPAGVFLLRVSQPHASARWSSVSAREWRNLIYGGAAALAGCFQITLYPGVKSRDLGALIYSIGGSSKVVSVDLPQRDGSLAEVAKNPDSLKLQSSLSHGPPLSPPLLTWCLSPPYDPLFPNWAVAREVGKYGNN
jgi:hypothetical protein